MVRTLKPEKRNALIVLGIFVAIVSIYYSRIDKYLVSHEKRFFDYNEDIVRNKVQLIESRGFIAETHNIVTDDGYILTVNRILNPFIKNRTNLKPILLQHGFQNSANAWLINSDGKLDNNGEYIENGCSGEVKNTLGFVLAQNNYDVWLSNMRGNMYSLNHTKYTFEDSEFWKFSIDQMIEYDLPALISYIQNQTSKVNIGYIGHSQGTYMMFGLLATKPQYSQTIKPFIALSPVPFMGNMTSPLKYLQYFVPILKSSETWLFHFGNFQKFYSKLCDIHYLQEICYKILYIAVGFQREQFDFSRTGVYIANLPSGSSTWNAAHLLMSVMANKPTKFDYGSEENLNRYNSITPPIYDLTAINSTNIALIYTANDWLNDIRDIDVLKQNLKVNLLDDYLVPDLSWNHMELLWAKDSGKLVNKKILELLELTQI